MIRTKGLDISHWQGGFDPRIAYANGARFMYFKASQNVPDSRFAENWKKTKGIMPRGAYHYLDWGWSEIEQAKLFVKTMAGDWGELPPCLDFEMYPAPYGLSAALCSGKAWNFVRYVEEATRRIPMIYTGYYFWNDWGSNNSGWAKYPLWLPWYASETWIKICTKGGTGAPKPWTNWTIWQTTDKANGLAYGVQSLNIDTNLFNGSETDLEKFCDGAPVLPPPPLTNVYMANCNPRVRSTPDASSMSNVIGLLTRGMRVVADIETNPTWLHFKPDASFPSGGWVWRSYLTKV
jgi:lysozyme